MKYSYNWLKDISGTKMSPEKTVEALTMRAFEVEEAEKVGADLAGVVVGQILEIEKHPNADKLQLTKVDIGKETLQIVCGAHNISVGDKVPVATVGTVLPGNFEIKEAEIRGIKSFGMLCAEDELGLGTDHSGIIILDKSLKLGTPISKVSGGSDTIFEIKILPDRAHDAMSHVGLAREIAALGHTEVDYAYDELELPKKKSAKVSVLIGKGELCQRYIAAVMENVTVGKSPQWLRTRLERCGIRSINNVVDVTNYVMLELGQPLHAFDFDKISDASSKKAEIIVRCAKKGEKMQILDSSEKELAANDIVIATKKEAIALAGVMGGSESGVTENTTHIVLEAATFNPVSIRKTRTRLNLPTDAALRFEKDIDPNLAEKAMVRAIELLEHLSGASLDGSVDVYPKKKKAWNVTLDGEYAQRLLGEKISEAEIKKILLSLGFGLKKSGKKTVVAVPTYRLDVLTQEDLIEEIGRIYGYDKIKPAAPLAALRSPRIDEKRTFVRQLKNMLAGQGFSEVYNYAFYGQKDANMAGFGSLKHLELETPLSPEQALLRVSLIPNMLKNVAHNLKQFRSLNIFEIGRVFWPDKKELPTEKTMLVGAVTVEQKGKKEKQDRRSQSPFFAAKTQVDALMPQLGIVDYYYDNLDGYPSDTLSSTWHESRSAQIKVEGYEGAIGYVGEMNPFMLANFDIHTRVAMFEFDLGKLRDVCAAQLKFQPISKYPIVSRDISMVVGKETKADDIFKAMRLAGGNLVLDVDLFDIFDFEDGNSSYAFHVMIGADDRTLKSEEIDAVMEKITCHLETELNLQVRK